MNGDAAREKLAAALMPVIGEVIDERDVHYTATALLPVVREIAATELRAAAVTEPSEPTVLPDRLYDITAEWLWREYGHVYERDWNRDAWRLLVMVRAVIDEYATPPAALPE